MEMKVLHVSDLHLDTPFSGISKTIKGLHKRLIDAPFQAFERCVSIAINQEVELFLISGDIYNAESQTIYAQHFFYKQMQRLETAQIPVVLLFGNHDFLNLDNILPKFPNNVHYFSDSEVSTIRIETAKGKIVDVNGFSYTKRWISRDKSVEYPEKKKGADFTIGMLHGQKYTGEQDHYAPFKVEALVATQYDYWALGHIHQGQVVHSLPLIQYSGIIQGRHKNETGDKGAYMIMLEQDMPPKSQFISLAPIVWQQASIVCQANDQATDLIQQLNDIKANYEAESQVTMQSQLITVRLTKFERLDKQLQGRIESGELLQLLDDDVTSSRFVAIVELQYVREINSEPFEYDETLKESFVSASAQLHNEELYETIMSDVFQHAAIKQWLPDMVQDQELKLELVNQAKQLVVEAIGYEFSGKEPVDEN